MEVTLPEFEKYVEKFIEHSEYEFDHFPIYQKTSEYGHNVLYLDRDTFYTSEELSLAAELPAGTSLKVIMKGGMWHYRAFPMGPKNWDISIYHSGTQSQEFSATSPGDSSDVNIKFTVETGSQSKFIIEYYENGTSSPTRIREIVVKDRSYTGDLFIFPVNGNYGPNILAQDDSISLKSGVKYSIAVDFPDYEEASISLKLSFDDSGGDFTTDSTEVDWWMVKQDSSDLEISASGKNIWADMSIIFNKSGWCYLEGDQINKNLRID
ncbi:hypothetical protein ACFLTA_10115 [Bacteroidota bacterium]